MAIKRATLVLVIALVVVLESFGGVRFDGVDDVLHSDTHVPFAFTNQLTVSFWIIKEAGMAASCEFIGKGRVINGNNLHWSVRDGGSGKFEYNFASPSGTFHNFTTTSGYLQTNVPIHVAYSCAWGNSNSSAFYINGVRVAAAWTANPSHALGITNVEPFRIGQTYSGSNARCSIFEPAVWNGILTDPEIYSLGTSRKRGLPLQIQPANLRFYAPLEDKFPAWTTMSGSNALSDVTQFHTPLTPLNSPTQHPMRWLSPMR
jgi:hypothetical protein